MKAGKGKAAKKKLTFEQRKAKAEKWLSTQELTGNALIKAYRKKFAVDRLKAISELQRLGKTFTKEEISKEKQAVEAYKRQQQQKKIKRRRKRLEKKQQLEYSLSEQDDMFCYIAGYTSCGMPYGLTWEEVGIDGDLPFDIKTELYKNRFM